MDATKTRKTRNGRSETTDERRWTQIEFRAGFVSSGLASAAPVGQCVLSWLSISGFGSHVAVDLCGRGYYHLWFQNRKKESA